MLKSIHVVTLFPEMFESLRFGVVGRFLNTKQVQVSFWNPRDYADNISGYVDDAPYGGGGGMVMQAPPLARTIKAIGDAIPGEQPRCLLMSPSGVPYNHAVAESLSTYASLTLVCGRYEGIDQRFCDRYVDQHISIGDFVLSGGELAAMILIDSVLRLMPGCLGNANSSRQDSFVRPLLDHPHYTRPQQWQHGVVPEALMSGDPKKVAEWRLKAALGETWLRRPDLLAKDLDCNEKKLLLEYASEYLNRHEESS